MLLKEEKPKDKSSKEGVKELKKWLDGEDIEKRLKKQKERIQKFEKDLRRDS
ncbi:MAG: hypothetical protein V3R82_06775 [Candidatus Hydrothermarchaeales archaeon]